MREVAFAMAALAMACTAPAEATELFGGVYVHDVDTPLTKSGIEGGADLIIGVRGNGIAGSRFQPYGFVAVNSAGETHYGAIGIAAKFGDAVYIRPGLGLALHTGSDGKFQRDDRIAFGSRILFEPEIAVGAALGERMSVEASWVHMSHATLFSRQNPGIDNFGVRLNFRL